MFLIICLILIVLSIYGIKYLCDEHDIVLWTTNFEMFFTYLLFIPPIIISIILLLSGVENFIILYLFSSYLLFAFIWLVINSYENNSNWWKTLIAIIVRVCFATITFIVLVFLLLNYFTKNEDGKDD